MLAELSVRNTVAAEDNYKFYQQNNGLLNKNEKIKIKIKTEKWLLKNKQTLRINNKP